MRKDDEPTDPDLPSNRGIRHLWRKIEELEKRIEELEKRSKDGTRPPEPAAAPA